MSTQQMFLGKSGGFPVFDPEIQWAMSAQNLINISSMDSSSSAQIMDGGYPQNYSGGWIVSDDLTVNSYTNSSGVLRRTVELAPGAALRPGSAPGVSAFTSGNSDIISNQGFTMWFTFIPYTAEDDYIRPFNYWGLAKGSSGSNYPSDDDEYKGPFMYIHRDYNANELQFVRPCPDIDYDHGDWSSSPATESTPDLEDSDFLNADAAFSIVWRQDADTSTNTYQNGTGEFWLRNTDTTNGTILNTADGENMKYYNLITNGIPRRGSEIRVGTDTGLPVFNDNEYQQGGAAGNAGTTTFSFMEAGFANRKYTTDECFHLVEYLNVKYG